MNTSITERDVLIVTDPQRDFCPGGALAVPEGDAIMPVVNRLARRFAHVVVTQDWHPPGHMSFASAHPGIPPLQTLSVDVEVLAQLDDLAGGAVDHVAYTVG